MCWVWLVHVHNLDILNAFLHILSKLGDNGTLGLLLLAQRSAQDPMQTRQPTCCAYHTTHDGVWHCTYEETDNQRFVVVVTVGEAVGQPDCTARLATLSNNLRGAAAAIVTRSAMRILLGLDGSAGT